MKADFLPSSTPCKLLLPPQCLVPPCHPCSFLWLCVCKIWHLLKPLRSGSLAKTNRSYLDPLFPLTFLPKVRGYQSWWQPVKPNMGQSLSTNTVFSCLWTCQHLFLWRYKWKHMCMHAQSCPTLCSHGLQPARLLCPWKHRYLPQIWN